MLTQAKLKAIKPLAKIARHHDQHGLYLQVMPNGSKYWRLKYHIRNGDKRVEKTLALGVYPEVVYQNNCFNDKNLPFSESRRSTYLLKVSPY